MPAKIVSNQLSPNLKLSDAFLLLGNVIKKTRKNEDFSAEFGTDSYLLFNAARSALGYLVERLNLPKNKKIGLPAFICAVVATPFLGRGYDIEWIDTDENGVIDFDDFQKKSAEISLLICPHIFGQSVDMKKFYELCQAKNILLIEDCAHKFDLPNDLKYCDAQIVSFGREKVHSCVSGGALIWNKNSRIESKLQKKSAEILELDSEEIISIEGEISESSDLWNWQHVIQPLILSITVPIWNWGGKILAGIASRLRILPRAVTAAEKSGREDFPITRLAVPFQKLLKRQFKNSAEILAHRKSVAEAWRMVLTEMFPGNKIIVPENAFRVILRHEKSAEIKKSAEKIGFSLRDWEGIPISPAGVDLEKFGYQLGHCPEAERFAQSYVTFPTNVRTTLADVERFAREFTG